jgi:hypothetical protein
MSQNPLALATTGTYSGLTAAENINAAIDSLNTMQSGASAPTNQVGGSAELGNLWLNTASAPYPIEVYDGAQWITLGYVDPTNHLFLPIVGGGVGTLASASTTDLGSVNQTYVNVTGTTTVTSLGSSAKVGQSKTMVFSGALTLTNNATSLILPTGANIVTAAGDVATATYLGGGNWKVTDYRRASGVPLSPLGATATLASAATADLGSTGSNIVAITGSTTISAFGSSANLKSPLYFVTFAAALTLTYNATSMILPTAASISVSAGDSLVALYLGSGNWQVLVYQPANGAPIALPAGIVDPWMISGGLPTAMSGTNTTASITVNTCICSAEGVLLYSYFGGGTVAVANGANPNGYAGGATLPNSSTVHVYLCKGTSGYCLWMSTTFSISAAGLSLPGSMSGYAQNVRRLFSFNTNSSGAPIAYTARETNGGGYWASYAGIVEDMGAVSVGTSRTFYAMTVPTGIDMEWQGTFFSSTASQAVVITSPYEPDYAPVNYTLMDMVASGSYWEIRQRAIVTYNATIGMRASASSTIYAYTWGFRDARRS